MTSQGHGGERCTCGHTVFFHVMSLTKKRCMAMTRDGNTAKGRPKFVYCGCKDFSVAMAGKDFTEPPPAQ